MSISLRVQNLSNNKDNKYWFVRKRWINARMRDVWYPVNIKGLFYMLFTLLLCASWLIYWYIHRSDFNSGWYSLGGLTAIVVLTAIPARLKAYKDPNIYDSITEKPIKRL